MTHRTMNHMQSMTIAYDETNRMLRFEAPYQCHCIRLCGTLERIYKSVSEKRRDNWTIDYAQSTEEDISCISFF